MYGVCLRWKILCTGSPSIQLEITECAVTQNPSETGFKLVKCKRQKGQNQYSQLRPGSTGQLLVEETSSDLQSKSKGVAVGRETMSPKLDTVTQTHMQTSISEQPNGTVTDRAPAPFTQRTIVCWAGKKPVERVLLVLCLCWRGCVSAS